MVEISAMYYCWNVMYYHSLFQKQWIFLNGQHGFKCLEKRVDSYLFKTYWQDWQDDFGIPSSAFYKQIMIFNVFRGHLTEVIYNKK